jgi:TrmH family RNA methyltransferase
VIDSSDEVTSVGNAKVRSVRALLRRQGREEQRAFVAEGVRVIEEGFRAGVMPSLLFCTPSTLQQPRAKAIVDQARQTGCDVRTVSDRVMAAMAATVTPSGILAVFPIPPVTAPGPLNWILIADGLRDPGNLGTILRSAWATHVQLVITTPSTVDLYGPKVVRAAMGAHFHLALWADQGWPAVEETVRGLNVLLAKPRAGEEYWKVDWRRPTALLIGGEAAGASAEAERFTTGYVNIPMDETTESVNASVAASILLFEAARQRR